MMKKSLSTFGIAIACIALISCNTQGIGSRQPDNAIPISLPLQTQAHLRDFDLVIKSVRDVYLDGKLVGASWQPTISTYRQQIASSEMNDEQFLTTFGELLSTLNDTDLVLNKPAQTTAKNESIPITSTENPGGIGINAGYPEPGQNRILILAIYPNSPADRAGLKARDAIVSIDGVAVTYADRDAALARIRGRSGSRVTLTIETPGKGRRDVTLIRQPITVTNLTISRSLPNTNIGYIMPDPTSGAIMPLLISEALRDMSRNSSLKGLILDLRTSQNMDFPIESILTLFVNGDVGARYMRVGKQIVVISGKNIAGSQDLPLIVLVSDQTMGSSESFAGILKELGRAKVIGTATPGRNAEIASVVMPNSSGRVLIPAAEYRGRKGQSWYRIGVKPDISSDQLWQAVTDENDTHINLALQNLITP